MCPIFVGLVHNFGKVRTFRETHKIWKNLPHGFDISADLLSKRQNHEEHVFQIMCASQKVRTLSLMMTLFSEKNTYSCMSLYMRWPLRNFYTFIHLVDSYRNTISNRCISGLMSNLNKKSWTVFNIHYAYILKSNELKISVIFIVSAPVKFSFERPTNQQYHI